MEISEKPIILEEQVKMMKKYVVFRQYKRMRKFLNYTGYFRASRYGKFLLSKVGIVGSKQKQDVLFDLYSLDVELRRILNYYCNRAEIRFKSAISNACAIKLDNSTFYLEKEFYTPSRGAKDAVKRKRNKSYFDTKLFIDIVDKESDLRKNKRKYPELREYRRGGTRQENKLPVWVAFSYFEMGTVMNIYNYLRGDLRKTILEYAFNKKSYSKKDTEVVDTWLDAVRNLRNYCAHNSMLIDLKSSVVLYDQNDEPGLLKADNDLFSRIYALKKLIPIEDIDKMKKDLKKIIKETSIEVYLFGIFPENWEEIYDNIEIF